MTVDRRFCGTERYASLRDIQASLRRTTGTCPAARVCYVARHCVNVRRIRPHYSYMTILAALVSRTRTARGQFIDASVHDACALTTEAHVNTYIYREEVVIRQTGRHASVSPTGRAQFRCKDGKYVNAGAARVTFRQFPALVEWMDSYGLAGDLMEERYKDSAVFSQSASHINVLSVTFVANLTRDDVAYVAWERGFTW